MTSTDKQTIYIDIDDEITSIIDKVKNSSSTIVALVLPKRATVLQSIVNMKLLKKSALQAKKNIVLITSEAGLLPLAGAVGLHVAKTLQSKPMIPLAPDHDDTVEPVITEESDAEKEPEIDKTKSVGSFAGIKDDEDEAIELDDEQNVESSDAKTGKPKKDSIKSKFKVPNFDRFRLSFFLTILVVILVFVGWVFAGVILPKATIVITTDTTTNLAKVDFIASTTIIDLSIDKAMLPAVQKEVKKTDTEKATATGKKDNGVAANGTISIKNCEDSSSRTLAAGTGFTSSSGKTYLSSSSVLVPAGTFTGGGANCTSTAVSVNVSATAKGAEYNQDAGTYTSSSSALSGNFRINGSSMTGGSSSIVTVVSQDDVDAAVAKMKGRLDNDAKKELASQLKTSGLKSLDETLAISTPAITSVPAVGAEASGEITVTQITTYNVLGIKQEYLSQLVKKNVESKIDLDSQSILDDGLDESVIKMTNRKSPTEAQMSIQSLTVAGPMLNADEIKDEIKGKKRGDVVTLISQKEGVKDVTVSYSPFWVYSTPKATKKITIKIEKPVVNTSSSTNP